MLGFSIAFENKSSFFIISNQLIVFLNSPLTNRSKFTFANCLINGKIATSAMDILLLTKNLLSHKLLSILLIKNKQFL